MRLILLLILGLVAAIALSIAFGETGLSLAQYGDALSNPSSPGAEILFGIRAPRACAAALTGAALGLAGRVMQAIKLRNPLAEPGVLGVSAWSGCAAALAIALGLGAVPGVIEGAALGGALAAGAAVALLAARFREPETLILFGVALAALGGAMTALVFNLSPSPITLAEVLAWLQGSVANRDWSDLAAALVPMALGAGLCAYAAGGLRMLTLGEEAAALSGLPMARLRVAAVAGAALLTGASVAVAGVIGFVGLAAPHLVRGSASDDPARVLAPSAIAGAPDPALTLADLRRAGDPQRGGVAPRVDHRPVRRRRCSPWWPGARPGAGGHDGGAGIDGRQRASRRASDLVGRHAEHRAGRGSGTRRPQRRRQDHPAARGARLAAAFDSGEVRLGGRPLDALNERERAAIAGYLPQERRVAWNMPARDIAALGAVSLPPAEGHAIADACLAELEVGAPAGRGVLDMSGGERARVLLARLLATRPKLLVADEPAAGLDPEAQLLILERLRQRATDGAAVIVTSHDLTLAARACDRLAGAA